MQLITIKKGKNNLIPADDESFKLFNSLDLGQEISFEYKVKRQRSYQYHKLYFAMLKAVLQNQQHYKTIDNLHEVVKFRSGYYETIIPLKGEPFIVTKSLSFDKMDRLQFDFFMKEAKTVCAELVSDEALEEILRFL
jgi:hypothetical protein